MFHLHACHIFWHVEYFWTCLEVQLIVIKAVNNISVSWCLFNEPIEIDELMKLVNHSDQEAKGAICIYIYIYIYIYIKKDNSKVKIHYSNGVCKTS